MIVKLKSLSYFGAVLLILSCLTSYAAERHSTGTRGYSDERYKAVEPYNGPARTGVQVYNSSCATCHNRTTQGAPLPDDDVEWGRRLKKGNAVLLEHVMNGYKELMPPKGGCRNCTEAEVQAAINFIFKSSGIEN
jgi:cytochrome c5